MNRRTFLKAAAKALGCATVAPLAAVTPAPIYGPPLAGRFLDTDLSAIVVNYNGIIFDGYLRAFAQQSLRDYTLVTVTVERK